MPLPLLAAGALLRAGVTAATLAPYLKPGLAFAKRFLKQTARPGAGSKVTKGPLMVGKTKVYGASMPGSGKIVGGLGAVAAVGGIGAVAAHRSTQPKTQPQPQPFMPQPKAKTEKKQKCCPLGTKRMVCFKRGRVKKKKAKAKPRKARKPKTRKTKKRAKRARRK